MSSYPQAKVSFSLFHPANSNKFPHGHQRDFKENICFLWSTISVDKHLFASVSLYRQIKKKVKIRNTFSCTNNKHNHSFYWTLFFINCILQLNNIAVIQTCFSYFHYISIYFHVLHISRLIPCLCQCICTIRLKLNIFTY